MTTKRKPAPTAKPEGESFISAWSRVIRGGAESAATAAEATLEAAEQAAPADPLKGQVWVSVEGARSCRVMCAPVDGWVMARFKAAKPFVKHVNDWHKEFRRPA